MIRIKEEQKMTVGSQIKQTLAGLKSAQASFEQFALQTENQQAKQLYENAAQQHKPSYRVSKIGSTKSRRKNHNIKAFNNEMYVRVGKTALFIYVYGSGELICQINESSPHI